MYMLWLVSLSAAIAAAAKRMRGRVATGASFAVELAGPAVAAASDDVVLEFARRYGPVAQLVRPSTVGVALSAASKVRAVHACTGASHCGFRRGDA